MANTLEKMTTRGSLLITVSLQIASVVLGHFWGVIVHYPGRPPSIYSMTGYLGILLMCWGFVFSLVNRSDEGSPYRIWVCFWVFLGSLGMTFSDPFLDVHQVRDLIIACLVLVPLLVAIGYLVRERVWLSVTGVTLFVFTSSAMITSNARVSTAGSGFIGWWIS